MLICQALKYACGKYAPLGLSKIFDGYHQNVMLVNDSHMFHIHVPLGE